MPKNLLRQIGRRKSSGNALEFESDSKKQDSTPGSSFKVLERPNTTKDGFHGGLEPQEKLKHITRPFSSPLQTLKGRSVEELGVTNRGSGGTTLSGSTDYYNSSAASARHSSSSTLPSSIDAEHDDDLFSRKTKALSMQPLPATNSEAPLPPPPSFSSRAARAFSFGNRNSRNVVNTDSGPPVPPLPLNSKSRSPERIHSPRRDRAMTTSSYASTAKPELSLGQDFGSSDFGSIFDNAGRDAPPQPTPPPHSYHRTDAEPTYPPQTHSRQAFNPSPNQLRHVREETGSPYMDSYDNPNDASEGLLSSPTVSSPRLPDDPPAPNHGAGIAQNFFGVGRAAAGYSAVSSDRYSPELERTSQDSRPSFSDYRAATKSPAFGSRQTQIDDGDRWVKRVELRDPQGPMAGTSAPRALGSRKPFAQPSQPTASGSRNNSLMSPVHSDAGESSHTTPRAAGRQNLDLPREDDEPLFGSSPQGPASRAIRPKAKQVPTASSAPKRMTKAEFEEMKRHNTTNDPDSEEDALSDEELEDEDDIARARRVAQQRQKQEANMSVYRQQMKKVTGGGPGELPTDARPGLDRASMSAPGAAGLHMGGMGGAFPPDTIRGKHSEDDDDDVPLGILQAHGFPGIARPPTRNGENDMASRQSSASIAGAGGAPPGNLPPFARRLPQDPYYGSSVVNSAQRESLAFHAPPPQSAYGGSQAPSQHQSQMGHPGGLVGVIAGEERARAARRGSPNMATGQFNGYSTPMPLPSNMPAQLNGGMRAMSMSGAPPQAYQPTGYNGPQMPQMQSQMPQMPQMPSGNMQPDQMQQFMQMQMQVMQNMLAMQQQQMGGATPPQPQQPPADYLSAPYGGQPQNQNQRPGSIAFSQRPGSIAPSQHPYPHQQQHLAPPPNSSQGRARTMLNPPSPWGSQSRTQHPRPSSALPSFAPDGPKAGYAPSAAPTERSTVGQPGRYRPVDAGSAAGSRAQSMTSSQTMMALTGRGPSPQPSANANAASKSTVRVVEKAKGSPRVTAKALEMPGDAEDEEGWEGMRKKRQERRRTARPAPAAAPGAGWQEFE